MRRLFFLSFLLVSISLTGYTQGLSPDMTVFGLKMGAKFTIPECEGKEITEARNGNSIFAHRRKIYQYVKTLPVKGACFVPGNYDGNDQDPHPPFISGNALVKYAPADAPQLCPSGSFNATIDNNHLVGISFSIWTENADKVFETLKKKYGNSGVVKNYTAQNGYGATLKYYTVVWTFKDLWVTLNSSLATNLSERYGSVTIQIPVKDTTPVDKTKL